MGLTYGDPRVPTYGYTFDEICFEMSHIFYHHPYNWVKQRISSDFGNRRLWVIETGDLYKVMRLPEDYCRGWQAEHTRIRAGGRFKNAYELLNLRALQISMLYKNHIFQCMGKIFCDLTHTLKDVDFIHNWKFKSSYI